LLGEKSISIFQPGAYVPDDSFAVRPFRGVRVYLFFYTVGSITGPFLSPRAVFAKWAKNENVHIHTHTLIILPKSITSDRRLPITRWSRSVYAMSHRDEYFRRILRPGLKYNSPSIIHPLVDPKLSDDIFTNLPPNVTKWNDPRVRFNRGTRTSCTTVRNGLRAEEIIRIRSCSAFFTREFFVLNVIGFSFQNK